jgi:hypothetical protein
VILCRSAYISDAEPLHHRQHVDDSPMLGHEAVLVEPHDVDELHVDALAGRGHADQLTVVSSGRSHARDDLVTAGQNVFGLHPQIGNAVRYMRKNSRTPSLVESRWLPGEVRRRGGQDAERLGRRRPAAIRSRSVIDRVAASYALMVVPAIARGTRRAAVSLLSIGTSDQN